MYVGPTLDGEATPYGSATIIQAAHTGTVVTFDPCSPKGLLAQPGPNRRPSNPVGHSPEAPPGAIPGWREGHRVIAGS